MKRDEPEMEKDELRLEYDLNSLRVRRLGSGRNNFGETVVRLEPNADAVNEALRFLLRVMQENKSPSPKTQHNNSVQQTDETS
ncbi:hypothetical protein H6G81_05570 [Scytonema hofmannii FACHB-248]|uniref:Uncharacterized protein n=1 Tax=Scytonema hofmannii FACHB-248 TaxID=1842502 RepID=A0ABR8GLS9_9CYAN|nr:MULTISPECIES: hypothetical protein [Nostocales]MBD2604010.1 hypothetical protein [Scytonema hofmannii FACHB-248]